MAYGGPEKIEDVEPYLLDVRNYRPTSPTVIQEITERYEQIGGRSPIRELTAAQAAGIERALNDSIGESEKVWRAFVGMRHWHPFVKDTLFAMQEAGIERAVGVVMAPHYSQMSIGAYYSKVEEAGPLIEVAKIEHWHLLPGFLSAVELRIRAALEKFPVDVRGNVTVIFTAHSLPERILEWDDPYPIELAETVEALGSRLDGHPYEFAFQSAAMTPDPWLGPDAGAVIARLHAEGKRHVLIAPIGFVCEHVEILYDIDIDFKRQAEALGMQLERIEMVNDAPEMMSGLAGLVREKAMEVGWL